MTLNLRFRSLVMITFPFDKLKKLELFLQLSSLDALVMLTRHFFGGAVALSLHGNKVLVLRPALQWNRLYFEDLIVSAVSEL